MNDVHSVSWQAPEHTHIEKTADWYWVLGILAVAGSVTSIILGNVLFGIVILLGAMVMFITGSHKPKIIDFQVSERGVRIESMLYPYSTLDSYYIDHEGTSGPQLLVRSKKIFVPLLILPLPEEYLSEIDSLLAPRLHEEHMHEPIAHKLMEFVGF